MNQCNFFGRLVADPKLRYTNNGKAVCNFRIAVNTGWGKYEHTEYIDIIVWNKRGEACAKYLEKGNPVTVQGELRIRKVKREDKTYINPEIRARVVNFLSIKKSKKVEEEENTEETAPPKEETTTDDIPEEDDYEVPF